jgi:hypothetical protein
MVTLSTASAPTSHSPARSAIMAPDRFRPRPVCRTLRLGVHLMTVSVGHLAPIVALLAGVLILIMPRLLNYIVAIYLIVTGIIGLGLIK